MGIGFAFFVYEGKGTSSIAEAMILLIEKETSAISLITARFSMLFFACVNIESCKSVQKQNKTKQRSCR